MKENSSVKKKRTELQRKLDKMRTAKGELIMYIKTDGQGKRTFTPKEIKILQGLNTAIIKLESYIEALTYTLNEDSELDDQDNALAAYDYYAAYK